MSPEMVSVRVGDLVFDTEVAAPRAASGEPPALVLLLHGFPQTSYTWREQLPALAEAGFLAAAPNQRGYSPGARPPDAADYATDLLVTDVLGIARSLGYEQFHLVGHDWGGQLSWLTAAQHPESVLSLTVLSRPHPRAFAEAMRSDSRQAHRSRHHKAFQNKDSARLLLEDGARRLRQTLSDQGVGPADIDAYLTRLDDEPTLDAAINWYRSGPRKSGPGTSGSALVGAGVANAKAPTLYLWGDEDATVGRVAAEATGDCVDGEYRFEVLAGAGHFLTDQAPERVTRDLLAHLRSCEASPTQGSS